MERENKFLIQSRRIQRAYSILLPPGDGHDGFFHRIVHVPSGDLRLRLAFPYPSGNHSGDDACDWNSPGKHSTKVLAQAQVVLLERRQTTTAITSCCVGRSRPNLAPAPRHIIFTCNPPAKSCEFYLPFFLDRNPLLDSSDYRPAPNRSRWLRASSDYWNQFWLNGGAVDFSACTDPRAPELERRVVLSQYLMAIQCAGVYPPQESGLTYNTWYGKFHLEMHWWHGVHFVLWGRPELLERSLDWYRTAEANAANIAQRQGFKGVRWMKMTDPSAIEAPSKVGSFDLATTAYHLYGRIVVPSPKDSSVWQTTATCVSNGRI